MLSGLCTYGSRMGTRERVRELRQVAARRAVSPHPAPALCVARTPSDGRDHPALHLRRGGGAQLRRQPAARGRAASVFLVGFSLAADVLHERASCRSIALAFCPVVVPYSVRFLLDASPSRFLTADEAEGELSAAVQENLTGVRVVRAFGRERFEVGALRRERTSASPRCGSSLGRLLSAYWGIGDLITGLQILTVIVRGRRCRRVRGEITLGEFLAFVSYNQSLVWPVRGLGRILSEMSKAGVSIERLALHPRRRAEEQEPGDALTPAHGRATSSLTTSPSATAEQPVLQDVSFTIPAGKTFAHPGRARAAARSTLDAPARPAVRPARRTAGASPSAAWTSRDISRAYLRRNIGIVLQEPFLFSRTIRENIAVARARGRRWTRCARRARTSPAWTRPSCELRRRLRHHRGRARRHALGRAEAARGHRPHAHAATRPS